MRLSWQDVSLALREENVSILYHTSVVPRRKINDRSTQLWLKRTCFICIIENDGEICSHVSAKTNILRTEVLKKKQ